MRAVRGVRHTHSRTGRACGQNFPTTARDGWWTSGDLILIFPLPLDIVLRRQVRRGADPRSWRGDPDCKPPGLQTAWAAPGPQGKEFPALPSVRTAELGSCHLEKRKEMEFRAAGSKGGAASTSVFSRHSPPVSWKNAMSGLEKLP